MVHRVLIFGHSFVHRLDSFLYENRGLGWYNLGFDGTEIQVEFFGLGGGTLRPGLKCIQKGEFMQIFNSFKPNTCFLQLGGNDLTNEQNPEKLAGDIASFTDYIITCYQVSHVIVGQLLPRYSERSGVDYNNKVHKVNNDLHTILATRDCVTFWKHRGLWKNTPSLLLSDKVHLNNCGMEIYAKSVRAAVGSPKRM